MPAFAARLRTDRYAPGDRTDYDDPKRDMNGNVLLDLMHGATTGTFPGDHDWPGEPERAAGARRAQLPRPPRRQAERGSLDPVHSAKGAPGSIDLARKGAIGADGERIVLHTGGSVGLFGCGRAFERGQMHRDGLVMAAG